MSSLKNLSDELLREASKMLITQIHKNISDKLTSYLGAKRVVHPWHDCDFGKANYRNLIGEWIVDFDGLTQIITFSEYTPHDLASSNGSLKYKIEVL
jgi:hypothetical protein